MKTWKQIKALPYGSPDQMDAADAWMARFMKLYRGGCKYSETARCDWLMDVLDRAYSKVIFSDEGYMAKRRLNETEYELSQPASQ